MASTIKFKRSSIQGKIPLLADLSLGELALNTFDGKLFIRKDNGTASIVEVNAGGGVFYIDGGHAAVVFDTALSNVTGGSA